MSDAMETKSQEKFEGIGVALDEKVHPGGQLRQENVLGLVFGKVMGLTERQK